MRHAHLERNAADRRKKLLNNHCLIPTVWYFAVVKSETVYGIKQEDSVLYVGKTSKLKARKVD